MWRWQLPRFISSGIGGLEPADASSVSRKPACFGGGRVMAAAIRGDIRGKPMWNQVYTPLGNVALSTAAAALPVVTLLVLIASNKVKAHVAAIAALIVANLVAIFIFTMPADMSLRSTVLGAVVGFFPIGWIVLNVIFMYRLTVATGRFETLQQAIGGVTPDRRLQLLLIAFAFGAFFEGASGFGTPVAVTGAILIGLGFSPLAASGLSLIA